MDDQDVGMFVGCVGGDACDEISSGCGEDGESALVVCVADCGGPLCVAVFV